MSDPLPYVADDDVLLSICDHTDGVYRLGVDDFDDPSEEEIAREEIHVTLHRRTAVGENTVACARLSCTSARELVLRLTEAIDAREGRA